MAGRSRCRPAHANHQPTPVADSVRPRRAPVRPAPRPPHHAPHKTSASEIPLPFLRRQPRPRSCRTHHAPLGAANLRSTLARASVNNASTKTALPSRPSQRGGPCLLLSRRRQPFAPPRSQHSVSPPHTRAHTPPPQSPHQSPPRRTVFASIVLTHTLSSRDPLFASA